MVVNIVFVFMNYVFWWGEVGNRGKKKFSCFKGYEGDKVEFCYGECLGEVVVLEWELFFEEVIFELRFFKKKEVVL